MTFDTWKTTPPADEECVLCSVAGCNRPATIDLTKTIHACSEECEEDLKNDLWCAECHALTAEGEDHAEDCQRGWEEAAYEDDLAREDHAADLAKALYRSARGRVA